jgi:hypothetical protein
MCVGDAVAISGLLVSLALSAVSADARRPLINDPPLLNIGFVCRWETRCMKRQASAMRQSLKHVKKYRVAAWKVEICNRNSSRSGTRKDWIGFNNCIRNPVFRPPAARSTSRHRS